MRVPRIVSAATIQGQRLFHSELLIVRLLFEGGVYSKKYGSHKGLISSAKFAGERLVGSGSN